MPILLILGTVKESGAKHKGLIEIPNLSEENDVDDTEVFAGVLLFSQASAIGGGHLQTTPLDVWVYCVGVNSGGCLPLHSGCIRGGTEVWGKEEALGSFRHPGPGVMPGQVSDCSSWLSHLCS